MSGVSSRPHIVSRPSLKPRRESGLVLGLDPGDPVNGILYDVSGNGNNGTITPPCCVELTPLGKGLRGYGRTGYVTVADAASLDMGTDSFSIEAWVKTDAILTDQLGDVLVKFDQANKRGYLLSLIRQSAFGSQSNYSYVQFGMDNNKPDNIWTQVAPQLGVQANIYSLAVYNGKLYGGTYPNGMLYEWNGVNAWVQVAPQLGAQTQILSLAVYNGKLYGGTIPNGMLYEWNGVNAWVQVAPQLGVQANIYSLAVYNGKLYGGTNPNGMLYEWETGCSATWQLEPGIAHIVGVKDNTTLTMRLYINGVMVDESTAFAQVDYDLDNGNPLYLGFGFQDYFNYVLHPVRVYKGRVLTDGEIRSHYLAAKPAGFATRPGVAVSSADEGGTLGQTIGAQSGVDTGLRAGDTTGRWRIETATIQGQRCKVVRNYTALGSLYLPAAYMQQTPTEAAFGTPEDWFYIPAASIFYWMPEASVAGAWNAAGQNGYRVTFDGTTGTISLHRITAGAVAATLYVSGAGVFTADTWFKYTRPRTTAGVFTGKVNDAVHNATGGGANPSAADVTHTTSTYQIFQNTTAVGAMFAWSDASGGHSLWKGVIAT